VVLPCVVDHAARGYGPVLGALSNAVEEVEEAVFSPGESRPTERIYRLSRQVLEFRRAVAPLTEMLDRLTADSSTAAGAGSSSAIASCAPTCSIWSSWPTALATCSPTCSRPT
jgi:Mg2+ and Co2+ transporter CorA